MSAWLSDEWQNLPAGARAALDEQWNGVIAGGLPCGAAVVDGHGTVVTSSRNHCYDHRSDPESLARYPLQRNRIAHAELNALARLDTDLDHHSLTMWSTQHPCSMCAAAILFVGIGGVSYIADDPSDHTSPSSIRSTRGEVPYQPLGDARWWVVSNLLFLYSSAVQFGEDANNIRTNQERYPKLVQLTRQLAADDVLRQGYGPNASLVETLSPYEAELAAVAKTIQLTKD